MALLKEFKESGPEARPQTSIARYAALSGRTRFEGPRPATSPLPMAQFGHQLPLATTALRRLTKGGGAAPDFV